MNSNLLHIPVHVHNVDSEVPVGIKNKSDQKFKADARVRLLKGSSNQRKGVPFSSGYKNQSTFHPGELRLRIKEEATRALGDDDASKDYSESYHAMQKKR
ncbi:unnamed protein product [Rhodiola kirilowii]